MKYNGHAQGQDRNLNNHNGQHKVLNMRVGEKADSTQVQRNPKHDFTPPRFSKQVHSSVTNFMSMS